MKPGLPGKILSLALLPTALLANPRDALWKQAEEAAARGLPKSAIDRLEPIIAGAEADKAYAEAIKAVGCKIALESGSNGDEVAIRIELMRVELAKAPEPMRPVMEALLADWYWHYFRQNRWDFAQRTRTAAPPGPDFRTWDLPDILAEIDRCFSAALADPATLEATPISTYDELLANPNAPDHGRSSLIRFMDDRYRPTLFDFVVGEALQFYTAGEQESIRSEDEYEVEAASPIFGPDAAFLAWRPGTTDTRSAALKAISLFQALLRFHQHDTDRSAFYDADLARLIYGYNVAVGEEKDERYTAALQLLLKSTSGHEISTRVLAAQSALLNARGDPAQARQLAQRGLDAFPNSPGAATCFNLIRQIEARNARLDTESVWNAPWPTLNVTYRNVTKVTFRAVAADFGDYVARWRWNGAEGPQEYWRKELMAAKPALEWAAELPRTADFKERTERLPVPTSLKPGFYYIIAGFDRAFEGADDQISVTPVCVTDLELVLEASQGVAPRSGLVLQASSGEPVAGAKVRIWRRFRTNWSGPSAPVKTDENGRFQFDSENQSVLVLAESGGQAVSSSREMYTLGGSPESAGARTVFFTDRSIYRPGQTIDYKGVSIRYDREAGLYQAAPDIPVTVLLCDPNGEEIARSVHTTNAYGSFAGTFIAPNGRSAGAFTIRVLDGEGAALIRVEEYKRPKFRVDLEPPAEAPGLDATVSVPGRAVAYTGAPIGGAKVKWLVTRSTQCPSWCWWWRSVAGKTIAHGAALLGADGSFAVRFTARADRAVPPDAEPVFDFDIDADVTDTTGETRSSHFTLRAGYTALQASLEADAWQTPDKPVEFSITTRSLDGDPQPAGGTLKVYALAQPATVPRASVQSAPYRWGIDGVRVQSDPTNPDAWKLAGTVAERSFKTGADGAARVAVPLKAGIYRATLETQDRFGARVTARQTVQVVAPGDARYPIKLPDHFTAKKWSVEPGETFTGLWGTGYDAGRAFVEVECNSMPLRRYWTATGRTQELIKVPVTEAMRGGFTVRTICVRENRLYLNERIVDVPWSSKQLSVRWERFRSKLAPGGKETWTAVVTGPHAKPASAEMVAVLYDASLDQYRGHEWPDALNVFRREVNGSFLEFQDFQSDFQSMQTWPWPQLRLDDWRYRSFGREIIGDDTTGDVVRVQPFAAIPNMATGAIPMGRGMRAALVGGRIDAAGGAANFGTAAASPKPEPDLGRAVPRRNLDETAFFFPHLVSGARGVVRISFTAPEALTQWRFLGFAHDKELRSGLLTGTAVTSKDLMVEPNPPRFVREGDAIEFTVKVSNQGDKPRVGVARLTFSDADTLKPVDRALGNRNSEQPFEVPARQSRSYSWRIVVPDGMGLLAYKAVAASSELSDGEEGYLPVLSRRIPVTESLPLPIPGKTTREFVFKKLLDSGASHSLRSQSLTLQMTSQPVWYAVLALPYLMEFPHECSEQVFNRFYANALARHIVDSDPRIRCVFDLWRNTPALASPLGGNRDLASVALEETPWLPEAKDESQARRNVGLLFDSNRLDGESAQALRKLSDQQLAGGLWPWFPGGPPSETISLYIVAGFGRLRHLGADVDIQPAAKALAALDAWMDDRCRRVRERPDADDYVPDSEDAFYLYARSFFIDDQPVAAGHRAVMDFLLRQARNRWVKVGCIQSQAHLALALQRFGDKETPRAIVRSLKERSAIDADLGRYWPELESDGGWYSAPIETQTVLIETFDEVAHDAQAVEDCKVWLLEQKQTQDWRTTKATADAVYALLMRGDKLLDHDARVAVALGGGAIKPEAVEAGTGFYERRFVRDEVKPAMGRITVTKTDDGVSWGAVHWRYLEDIAKVAPHAGFSLSVTKTLYVKETTSEGQILRPLAGPASVGDELVVRIELRADRDMEFVHLEDQRGSGVEPVDVLSGYRYRDGLGFYESTRDTATHFFFDYLPKGVHVIEYSTHAQFRGRYQTGIAEIQCMYAPEFNGHSESTLLDVK